MRTAKKFALVLGDVMDSGSEHLCNETNTYTPSASLYIMFFSVDSFSSSDFMKLK